jgi:hypothetical protein
MVLNATFNNISVISWRSVLLVEETGENHLPAASHWQTLSHNVVHIALIEIRTSVEMGSDCIGSCKSNYDMIMATTAPLRVNGGVLNYKSSTVKPVLNRTSMGVKNLFSLERYSIYTDSNYIDIE